MLHRLVELVLRGTVALRWSPHGFWTGDEDHLVNCLHLVAGQSRMWSGYFHWRWWFERGDQSFQVEMRWKGERDVVEDIVWAYVN